MTEVFEAMGTVVSVEVDDAIEPRARGALARLPGEIELLEGSLSAWRADSSLLRLRRGEDPRDAALDEVRALGTILEQLTDGAFDPHGPRGLDLDGVAKGWIVERASQLAFCDLDPELGISVAAGGDVWLRGVHRIGVAHPQRRDRLVAVVASDRPIATSGTSERGDHLRAPSGRPALLQATVVAPTLWLADGLATALVVAGESLGARLATLPRVGWLVVTREGAVHAGGDIEVLARADVPPDR